MIWCSRFIGKEFMTILTDRKPMTMLGNGGNLNSKFLTLGQFKFMDIGLTSVNLKEVSWDEYGL